MAERVPAERDWLVKALDQRARTIIKVASEIVKRQQGFFREGVSAMRPMTLREVAEAIEMHEVHGQPGHLEQISRCANAGCSSLNISSARASAATTARGRPPEAVKAEIGKLIAAETGHPERRYAGRHCSSGEGFDLARRTVAKYREAMGIGSSIQRRRLRKIAGMTLSISDEGLTRAQIGKWSEASPRRCTRWTRQPR